MALIDANDLAQLIADQGTAQPDSCTRTRSTYTADGYGGSIAATATATYACRVRPLAGGMLPKELVEAGKVTGTSLFVASLPYTADVIPSDTITHGSRTLDVLGVYRDPTWDTVMRVFCQERQ